MKYNWYKLESPRGPIEDGRNWYSYGAGEASPVHFADPEGHAIVVIIIVGAGLISIASLYAWLNQQGNQFNDAMEGRPQKRAAQERASETGDTSAYEDHMGDVRDQLEEASELTNDGIENNINPAPLGTGWGDAIHIGVDGYQGFRDLYDRI